MSNAIAQPQDEPSSAAWVEAACRELAAFFAKVRPTAEQLSPLHFWYRLLSRIRSVYARPWAGNGPRRPLAAFPRITARSAGADRRGNTPQPAA
jgi:hypothetical protein